MPTDPYSDDSGESIERIEQLSKEADMSGSFSIDLDTDTKQKPKIVPNASPVSYFRERSANYKYITPEALDEVKDVIRTVLRTEFVIDEKKSVTHTVSFISSLLAKITGEVKLTEKDTEIIKAMATIVSETMIQEFDAYTQRVLPIMVDKLISERLDG